MLIVLDIDTVTISNSAAKCTPGRADDKIYFISRIVENNVSSLKKWRAFDCHARFGDFRAAVAFVF